MSHSSHESSKVLVLRTISGSICCLEFSDNYFEFHFFRFFPKRLYNARIAFESQQREFVLEQRIKIDVEAQGNCCYDIVKKRIEHVKSRERGLDLIKVSETKT